MYVVHRSRMMKLIKERYQGLTRGTPLWNVLLVVDPAMDRRRTADDGLNEAATWSWMPLEESIALKYTTDPAFQGWIFMSPQTPVEGCRDGQVAVHVHQWVHTSLPSAFPNSNIGFYRHGYIYAGTNSSEGTTSA